MATPVILPKQGNSVESCIIKAWLKQPGDEVKEGDGLCEVETDKATVEVPAPAAGILLKIFRAAGDDVAVMTAIAAIGTAGEDVSKLAPGAATASAVEIRQAPGPAPVIAAPMAKVASSAAGGAGSSPLARQLAFQGGIATTHLVGSGPGGLVTARDVRAAASAPRPAPANAAIAPVADISGAFTDVPVAGIRKRIAERMRASLAQSAQLTLHTTCKAVALQAWRAKAKAAGNADVPSIGDLIAFAVSRVIQGFPSLNAHFLGTSMRQFSSVHLGIAVDTDRGLMVPVIRDCHLKSLVQLSAEFKPVAKACQAGQAKPEQLSGSTFTITNLGTLGIEQFTPVLNSPEVAILGVGGITLKPYQGKTAVEFLPALHFSLTIDHQANDGAPAARFLQALVKALEDIDRLAG